jgi:hypothetical protein
LKIESSDSNFKNIKLDEIVQSLTEAGFEDAGGGCDMGIKSYSILIFDNSCSQYKRIILKTLGDKCLTNKSLYTSELLKYFKKS